MPDIIRFDPIHYAAYSHNLRVAVELGCERHLFVLFRVPVPENMRQAVIFDHELPVPDNSAVTFGQRYGSHQAAHLHYHRSYLLA